jgi:hypothetical protein
MFSPSEFARTKGYWHFDSVLQLPSSAASPMEGLRSVCGEFAVLACRKLGWGTPTLLETTEKSITYAIGHAQKIVLLAFWSEIGAFSWCVLMTRDRTIALEIEHLIVQHLPRITSKELLAQQALGPLSDREILMLGRMIEWGDDYSAALSEILCEAWNTRSDELRGELVWCFHSAVPYWRDFYPLLKESLQAGLNDPLEMYVQAAVDMMEFDMRADGQSED